MQNTPEVSTSVIKTPTRIKRLAYLLDSSIPLPGGRSIGLEAVIGFIPGVGDIAGALASCYIVAEGVRMGAPKTVVARMIGNVLLESTIGVVPVLGDLFDMVYKSNIRNIELLLDLEKASAIQAERPGASTLQRSPAEDATAASNKKKKGWIVVWASLAVAIVFTITVIWLVCKVLVIIASALV